MSFPIIDHGHLVQFVVETMRNRLDVNPTPGTLWHKVATVLAEALLTHSGHEQHVCEQIFPSTADSESLERHARLHGLSRKAAASAEGLVDIALGAK